MPKYGREICMPTFQKKSSCLRTEIDKSSVTIPCVSLKLKAMEFKQINNFQSAPWLLKTHYLVVLALKKYLSEDYIYI